MSVEFLSLSVKASKPGEWELPYISYIFIGMCPPPPASGRVFAPFDLKTGTDFAYFCLGSGMVFEGATGVYERIYRFNSKCEKRRRNMRILNGLE